MRIQPFYRGKSKGWLMRRNEPEALLPTTENICAMTICFLTRMIWRCNHHHRRMLSPHLCNSRGFLCRQRWTEKDMLLWSGSSRTNLKVIIWLYSQTLKYISECLGRKETLKFWEIFCKYLLVEMKYVDQLLICNLDLFHRNLFAPI